jgi:hypothetical protein
MPIELQYRDEGKGVFFDCTGVVTTAEVDDANREIYSEERLPRLRYQLVDYSKVEGFDISPEDTRRHAKMDKEAAEKNPRFVIAVVGPSDLAYGVTRMWQAFTDEAALPSAIFRTIPEAEGWIEKTLAAASE